MVNTQGTAAQLRLEAYARVTDRNRPSRPNLYLVMIGVAPEAQGQGYGRKLLEAVHKLS
jgi:ribosomal protein S18 acetylase RimI-like enzyme